MTAELGEPPALDLDNPDYPGSRVASMRQADCDAEHRASNVHPSRAKLNPTREVQTDLAMHDPDDLPHRRAQAILTGDPFHRTTETNISGPDQVSITETREVRITVVDDRSEPTDSVDFKPHDRLVHGEVTDLQDLEITPAQLERGINSGNIYSNDPLAANNLSNARKQGASTRIDIAANLDRGKPAA